LALDPDKIDAQDNLGVLCSSMTITLWRLRICEAPSTSSRAQQRSRLLGMCEKRTGDAASGAGKLPITPFAGISWPASQRCDYVRIHVASVTTEAGVVDWNWNHGRLSVVVSGSRAKVRAASTFGERVPLTMSYK
jgi:hypothetical protein